MCEDDLCRIHCRFFHSYNHYIFQLLIGHPAALATSPERGPASEAAVAFKTSAKGASTSLPMLVFADYPPRHPDLGVIGFQLLGHHSRAVDPHSLYADPDPAVFLNADPDPDPGLA